MATSSHTDHRDAQRAATAHTETSFIKNSGVLRERENASQAVGAYVTMEELVALANAQCRIDLHAQKRALAAMAGSHRSAFRGRGIDFDEVRIYTPGDDVRSIDWRVTARTGRTHTKVFREERERPVYLMVDQRQSMFFGSHTAMKSVVAARTAALLAWATREQGDRLGALIFNDQHVHELRPREGKRGIQALFRILVQFNQFLGADQPVITPSRQPFSQALEALAHVVRPGSLVVVISDFQQFDSISVQQLQLVKRLSDVIAISISDPLEARLPKGGTYGYTNGEQSVRVDTRNREFRKRFSIHFVEQQNQLREALLAQGIPTIPISTDAALADTLGKALGLRHRRGVR
ncbi:Hypothetical protein HDN1F_30450 [gamma proteobacterium HdN1]|nr:Hypothetical protein HDN1F_30450 [gamma proteobacterium HdN1]